MAYLKESSLIKYITESSSYIQIYFLSCNSYGTISNN